MEIDVECESTFTLRDGVRVRGRFRGHDAQRRGGLVDAGADRVREERRGVHRRDASETRGSVREFIEESCVSARQTNDSTVLW